MEWNLTFDPFHLAARLLVETKNRGRELSEDGTRCLRGAVAKSNKNTFCELSMLYIFAVSGNNEAIYT
jgi:hypothetical protein